MSIGGVSTRQIRDPTVSFKRAEAAWRISVPMTLRLFVCRAAIEPHLPPPQIAEVAQLLDREANRALNAGRFIFAERCSRRAEELREGAAR